MHYGLNGFTLALTLTHQLNSIFMFFLLLPVFNIDSSQFYRLKIS